MMRLLMKNWSKVQEFLTTQMNFMKMSQMKCRSLKIKFYNKEIRSWMSQKKKRGTGIKFWKIRSSENS